MTRIRKSRTLKALILAAFLLLALVPLALAAPAGAAGRSGAATRAEAAPARGHREFVPGELLVRFDERRLGIGADRAATADRAADDVGGRVARSFDRVASGPM